MSNTSVFLCLKPPKILEIFQFRLSVHALTAFAEQDSNWASESDTVRQMNILVDMVGLQRAEPIVL